MAQSLPSLLIVSMIALAGLSLATPSAAADCGSTSDPNNCPGDEECAQSSTCSRPCDNTEAGCPPHEDPAPTSEAPKGGSGAEACGRVGGSIEIALAVDACARVELVA